MAKPSCFNADGYSSPVPIIGLYIAGASFVCLLLMLCDILFALQRKARYIPCRHFSLSSVTLTLLSVVSKLPVDLTTSMPSARDQLSKLTGTTMTCICIGFMAPSLASNRDSESISNMAALSILVVTIAVNICIQIATGVIFSFIVEHIMVLCFMLMLLVVCWYSTFELNDKKGTLPLRNVCHFLTIPKGEPSLMHRVKSWYISSCRDDPQLVLCKAPLSSGIGPICIMCSFVLLQAAYRAILVVENSKFCGEASDYKWSMWIIVIMQIIAIAIGALAISFRWFAVVGHLELNFRVGIMILELQDLQIQFLFMKRRSIKTSILVSSNFLLKFVLSMLLFCIHVTVCAIPFIVFRFLFQRIGKLKCFMCKKTTAKDIASLGSWKKEFEFESQDGLSQRIIIRCVNNIDKWTNVKRDSSSSYMVQMLSRRRVSCTPPLLDKLLEVGKRRPDPYKVTCLSMVLLLKVGAATIPQVLIKSMRDTLHEAFEIIYYIDKKVNVGSIIDLRRRQFAKLFWEGGDIDLSKRIQVKNANVDPVRRAISNIESAFDVLPGILTGNELRVIRDFIKDREYTSVEELCDYMEQLFSEMLQFFLAQLPSCVFKEVNEGSFEDCAERARFITKRLCELDSSLEDKVQWVFPEACTNSNTSSFFDPRQNHVAMSQNNVSTP